MQARPGPNFMGARMFAQVKPNRRPTHLGVVLWEDVMPALGITQAMLASHLGVSRLTVSELLHDTRGSTAEMAVRVSRVVGGSPERWLRMQEALDIYVVGPR